MKQSSKKLLALMTAGMLCAGSLGALPAFAETEGETGENDTIETAEAIDVNTEVTGNLSSDNDVDCYKVTLQEDGTLSATFTRPSLNDYRSFWTLKLVNENNTLVQEWDIDGEGTAYRTDNEGIKAGTYYYIVSTASLHSKETYTLNVTYTPVSETTTYYEAEFNNDAESANPISVNTPYSGNIRNDNDVDYYSINLDNPGSLAIQFSTSSNEDNRDFWDIYLLDENENQIDSWKKSADNLKVTFKSIGLRSGKYYIKVTSDSLSLKDTYTIQANFTPSTDEKKFEEEHNDELSAANTFALNSSITGNIHDDKDIDYYALNLEQDGLIQFNFKHTDIEDSRDFWNYFLTDAEGNKICDWEISGTTTNQKTSKMGLQKGTYYLVVKSAFLYNDVDYIISNTFSSDGVFEAESNDTIETANKIPVATACVGNLYKNNDVDYYSFTVDKTSEVSISFNHVDLEDNRTFWNFSLLSGDENALLKQSVNGDKTNVKSDTVKLEKGTYFIKVASSYLSSDANYTLTVNAKEITYTKGDANADGSIDSTDVFEMMYSCAKKAVGRTDDLLEGENFLAADIDENGTLDSTDIFYEMLYIASTGAGGPVDWDSIVK